MGELIRDLEDQKLLVEQKGEELKKREMELLELKADMKRQQERLEAKQLNARREEAKKFAAKLEEKERLLEDILEKLKGSGASKKVVAESWNDIRIVKREALNEAENLPGIMSRLQQQQQLSQIELVPISEMKGVVNLNVDDKIIVCKKGAFYGKEGIVMEVGKKIQVSVDGVPVRLTTKELAFPPSTGGAYNVSSNTDSTRETTLTKLAKRGIDLESTEEASVDVAATSKSRDSGITMRMDSNTVNCIGMNFEESKRKCIDAFSKATMSNRSLVYILHGHGTGVLKQKIRTWLSSDRRWVKSFGPAEQADGGEALTRVELKKQNLFEL
jgi:DNA mismatch repair protein MutS2